MAHPGGPDLLAPVRVIGGRRFDFSRQVAVMAIVNRTRDSFYDRGATFGLDQAVAAVERAAADGADWVDIGGVPFGVDTAPVSAEEELDRVIPLVAATRERTDLVISVDTYRTEVARSAIDAGAHVVNDTSGLQDPALLELLAGTAVSLVIAHSLASPPRSRVERPEYADVTAEVGTFLAGKVALAYQHGLRPDQIIIDPGHDLNKNTYHSLELTRRLDEIAALGHPTLVAVSNKDFIGEALGRPQGQRLAGTLATLAVCVWQGARVVRVHDVTAAIDAVRMVEAVLGWREPVTALHNR